MDKTSFQLSFLHTSLLETTELHSMQKKAGILIASMLFIWGFHCSFNAQ